MPSPALCLTFLLLAIGRCRAQSVTQSPQDLTVSEGAALFLNCTFKVSGSLYLFWYVQLPGGAPQFLVQYPGQAERNGFNATHDKGESSFHLRKARSGAGDSGLYLCAVKNYGGGGTGKLTFGTGTRLTVTPNIKNSAPSAYVLKPAAGSEDQVGTACLVTDFSPAGNVTVYLNETEKGVRPATLVESEKKWSYGIVEWSPKKQDDQFKCRAEYKGQTIEAQEWKEDTQKSCSVISVSEYFETDEKLNTLSLTVLGLKIIFMKSIAFNLLMTLRLWTS